MNLFMNYKVVEVFDNIKWFSYLGIACGPCYPLILHRS